MLKAITINQDDNVCTLVTAGKKGEVVAVTGAVGKDITLNQDISYGHKCSLLKIKKGTNIVKYGEIIGRATEDINVGMHVHVHNVGSSRSR